MAGGGRLNMQEGSGRGDQLDRLKIAIAEYLLELNKRMDPDDTGYAFIPPASIDWMADELVAVVVEVERGQW
jgi:hypothetical protein